MPDPQPQAPASPTQAQQFLDRMRQMSPDAEQAFRAIYAQAPRKTGLDENVHSLPRGHHVRHAMIAALTHPEIAYWSRLNLAVRVARKLAQTTGQHHTAQRLEQTLEAFHRAADAFVLNQQLTEPNAPFFQSVVPDISPAQPALWAIGEGGLNPEAVSLIQQFKARVIPGLVQRIRGRNIA